MFSKLNGMKCMRVATASIQLTEDRAVAETQANIAVIGTHAAQRAARYAKEGEFERAQMETRAAQRFMHRNFDAASKEVTSWAANVEVMDEALREERRREKADGGPHDKAVRVQALKQHDVASVAISRSKQANAKKLFK